MDRFRQGCVCARSDMSGCMWNNRSCVGGVFLYARVRAVAFLALPPRGLPSLSRLVRASWWEALGFRLSVCELPVTPSSQSVRVWAAPVCLFVCKLFMTALRSSMWCRPHSSRYSNLFNAFQTNQPSRTVTAFMRSLVSLPIPLLYLDGVSSSYPSCGSES